MISAHSGRGRSRQEGNGRSSDILVELKERQNESDIIFSTRELKMTPRPMSVDATSTGLSPETHFGTFSLPALLSDFGFLSQLANNHRSKARLPLLLFVGLAIEGMSPPDSVAVVAKAPFSEVEDESNSLRSAFLSSSRYSLSSPLLLLIDNFLREVGTTWSAHTHVKAQQRTTVVMPPKKMESSGTTGSNVLAVASSKACR